MIQYGQSWMLMLLSEVQHAPGGNTPTVQAFRTDLEQRIISRLENSPLPEGNNNQVSGSYDSWLFSYMMLAMSKPTDPALLRRMQALKPRIDAARAAIAQQQPSSTDFLYAPAMSSVIDHLKGNKTAYPSGMEGALPPNPLPSTDSHLVGQAVMRLWPYAMDAANGNSQAAALFDQQIGEIMRRPDLYKSDFDTVGHWVPQFLWMAEYLRLGAP